VTAQTLIDFFHFLRLWQGPDAGTAFALSAANAPLEPSYFRFQSRALKTLGGMKIIMLSYDELTSEQKPRLLRQLFLKFL